MLTMNKTTLIAYALKNKGNYEKILNDIKKQIEVDLKDCDNAITIFDDIYPKNLLFLKDPPLVLFYKGNIDLLRSAKKKIAIVGSRQPNAYATKATVSIVKELNDESVIISGGAKGIDTIAHETAKETIAVLGCGIDYVYPKENTDLFKKIEKEGLLLSEYPGSLAPEKQNFLKRNRIVAALADEIYVMQISKMSGTLNTVNNALELNKEVRVLPMSIFEKDVINNKLIDEGARVIKLKEDK